MISPSWAGDTATWGHEIRYHTCEIVSDLRLLKLGVHLVFDIVGSHVTSLLCQSKSIDNIFEHL